ncbi:DM13 domain-containing protein [Streptosporangium longisporum]|uniref:DM13 domain-containing protein n=1 Tax=Streptosporangium longisporum TaxID=46187 RepID=A0ABN3XW55_9ACTN
MRIKRLLRHPVTRVVLVVGAVAAGVALYLFQPWRLFTVVEVNEALPVADAPSSPGAPGASASAAPPESAASSRSPAPSASSADGGTDGPTRPAETSSAPKSLATGTFVSHEHDTAGTAKVLELPDGRRILRIEDLNTSDGPDLRVWLSDQPVKQGRAGWFNLDDGKHLELGELKGNRGNANYAIPAGADLDDLKSVTVWCKRFSVSFGAAALR